MENLLTFVPENLMILIAAIYVLGVFLKKVDTFPDKYIVSLLMLFGITFAVLLNIINAEYKLMYEVVINGMLQGILCWGVSVGINQTVKQFGKSE